MRHVSIHAPVWVRQALTDSWATDSWFQFTHPCGCDISDSDSSSTVPVSIHAPVWVRRAAFQGSVAQQEFQFTHPCGCDILPPSFTSFSGSFNSRTRVGATPSACTGMRPRYVSIHAPVWVRPVAPQAIAAEHGVSIHAPVWVRRPDEYGLSIKHATKVLRQPDARTRCGQA